MRYIVEVHLCCDFLCREFAVFQQMLDFHHGELMNPVTWRTTAHLRRDFVEMLGRDAEFLSVVGDGSVLPVTAALEHPDEARHDVGRPLRHFFVLKESGMGIHGIEVEYAHTLQDGFLTISLRRMSRAESHVLEVAPKDGKRIAVQLEDGMHEQMQPAASAVAAVGHTVHLLLGGKKKLAELTVLRRLDAPHVACNRYHATAWPKRMLVPGEVELASARCA